MDPAEQARTELEQFVYVASHDLQEPLRMVASYVQLLARRYADILDDDGREFIGFAVDGVHRMQRLLDDLLAYSRVSTKAAPPEPIDCDTLLEWVLRDFSASLRETGGRVTGDPLPTVTADPTQLAQLFGHLIRNAITYRGDDPPQIHISAERSGSEWVFSVRDNGIGIAPEDAERVFGVFERLHGRDRYPDGTGMGLAVCRKIIGRLGGRIWVESGAGRGSTFRFTVADLE